MSDTSEDTKISSFAASTLPLYHGPLITIRIEPINREYTVSKNLLCLESPVFSAMLEGSFRESQEQTVTLQQIKGVLSTRSFEALLQWLYQRTIEWGYISEKMRIQAAVELARLAEMYEIPWIEDALAEYIKDIYARNDRLADTRYKLDDEATFLSERHPVRRVMAQAFVLRYLQWEDDYESSDDLMTQEHPKFAADLLYEVRETLHTLSNLDVLTVEEPITKKRRLLAKVHE
ncbi:hypothetical protein N7453_007031 [Penicillium expansum]|nr:hypothetical protein N7453_007031 [Penicillium expansum]